MPEEHLSGGERFDIFVGKRHRRDKGLAVHASQKEWTPSLVHDSCSCRLRSGLN